MADVIEIANYRVPISKEFCQHDPVINAMPLMTYDEFFEKFLLENRPCVFQSDITQEWRCRREWNANGAPNFKMLYESFGNCVAPVADCKKKYYNSQSKEEMIVKKYIDYWIEYREKNYSDEMPNYYLKDWHCVKEYDHLRLYRVPKFFASDWLNEFFLGHPELEDDYMFVYMGPKGTWTPFHADVFASYSWSANIVGKKKWLLFPPGEENSLCDTHGQLSFDATCDELKNSTKYPNYDESTLKKFEIIQEEGEIIFIPSGWHHQVWNLEDTISVNHNWINGCNVSDSWLSLRNHLSAIMRQVDDCRDMDEWEKHCQLMLKASHGMNYHEFFQFLSFIVDKRLRALAELGTPAIFHEWTFGTELCLFDLDRAKTIINCMMSDAREKQIYELIFPDNRVFNLLDDINEILPSANK